MRSDPAPFPATPPRAPTGLPATTGRPVASRFAVTGGLAATARLTLTALLAWIGLAGCGGDGEGGQETPGAPVERDMAAIQAGDTLTALVTYNSTGYFIYRGEPMGFEYRLLQAFAEDHDLVLRARVVRERDQLFRLLNEGAGDVVASRVVAAPSDTGHVAYTRGLYTTRPATVQQTAPAESANVPEAVDTILQGRGDTASRATVEIRARLIESPADLAGQEVHLPAGAFYDDRLIELSDSLGEDIQIVEVDSASYETLVRRLARGGIQLVIAPENVAKLRSSYFSNVEVTPVIGPEQPVTWAVRRNAPELLKALDAWIAESQELIEAAYERYFVDRRGYDERVESEYLTSETGRLSEYDDLFRQHAPAIGWDWRLLASQAFQESKFDPTARSWAGAMGILQLMPATAREVDVANPMDPAENVAGAVRYLDWLGGQWQDSIPDDDERLRFILASYNAGAGHVGDARRLAAKNGDDPNRWEDVAFWLLQKSKKSVYTDPVVKYGFARGLEPVMYVSRILDRYEHYREFVRPDGEEEVAAAGGGR